MLESFLLPDTPALLWEVLEDGYEGWPPAEVDEEGTVWSTDHVDEKTGDPR